MSRKRKGCTWEILKPSKAEKVMQAAWERYQRRPRLIFGRTDDQSKLAATAAEGLRPLQVLAGAETNENERAKHG